MIIVTMTSHANFSEWRDAARRLLHNDIDPCEVIWEERNSRPSLFGRSGKPCSELPLSANEIKAPAAFIAIAKRVVCHHDPERFAKLYRLLSRLQKDRSLLHNAVDQDIIWLTECDKAVRRDRHKMHAFVRFRKVGVGRFKREQYAAWFEPSHYITELATPFFMRRFPNMDWAIVTPDCTATWDGKDLLFGPGGTKSDVPAVDAIEYQWKTYFNSIFNPARLKVGAMMAEMPKKYWKNMPEAVDIPDMVRMARSREQAMRSHAVSSPNPLAATLVSQRPERSETLDEFSTLSEAKLAIERCRRCELYCHASQAVFGEGPENARIMIVGEQPGDKEDIAGRPFVGPAGKLLDDALIASGIDRTNAYVTNAVKHFKFKPRGKRRIHDRPNAREIDHCRWWLETERKLVQPDVIIALGASAARSILGRSIKVSEIRGEPHVLTDGTKLIVTVHPSYLLRLPDAGMAAKERNLFVRDLAVASDAMKAAKDIQR